MGISKRIRLHILKPSIYNSYVVSGFPNCVDYEVWCDLCSLDTDGLLPRALGDYDIELWVLNELYYKSVHAFESALSVGDRVVSRRVMEFFFSLNIEGSIFVEKRL